jgi:hypothetical protein
MPDHASGSWINSCCPQRYLFLTFESYADAAAAVELINTLWPCWRRIVLLNNTADKKGTEIQRNNSTFEAGSRQQESFDAGASTATCPNQSDIV